MLIKIQTINVRHLETTKKNNIRNQQLCVIFSLCCRAINQHVSLSHSLSISTTLLIFTMTITRLHQIQRGFELVCFSSYSFLSLISTSISFPVLLLTGLIIPLISFSLHSLSSSAQFVHCIMMNTPQHSRTNQYQITSLSSSSCFSAEEEKTILHIVSTRNEKSLNLNFTPSSIILFRSLSLHFLPLRIEWKLISLPLICIFICLRSAR